MSKKLLYATLGTLALGVTALTLYGTPGNLSSSVLTGDGKDTAGFSDPCWAEKGPLDMYTPILEHVTWSLQQLEKQAQEQNYDAKAKDLQATIDKVNGQIATEQTQREKILADFKKSTKFDSPEALGAEMKKPAVKKNAKRLKELQALYTKYARKALGDLATKDRNIALHREKLAPLIKQLAEITEAKNLLDLTKKDLASITQKHKDALEKYTLCKGKYVTIQGAGTGSGSGTGTGTGSGTGSGTGDDSGNGQSEKICAVCFYGEGGENGLNFEAACQSWGDNGNFLKFRKYPNTDPAGKENKISDTCDGTAFSRLLGVNNEYDEIISTTYAHSDPSFCETTFEETYGVILNLQFKGVYVPQKITNAHMGCQTFDDEASARRAAKDLQSSLQKNGYEGSVMVYGNQQVSNMVDCAGLKGFHVCTKDIKEVNMPCPNEGAYCPYVENDGEFTCGEESPKKMKCVNDDASCVPGTQTSCPGTYVNA